MQGDRVGDRGEPARSGCLQAEEAHEIGAVAVIAQRDLSELVAAGRRVRDRLALIEDIAQEVPVVILWPRLAEVRADAPVGQAHLVVRVAFPRQASKEHEAAPAHQVALDPFEARTERGEGKVVLADLEEVVRLGACNGEGAVDLRDLGVGEDLGPARGIGDVLGHPLATRLQHLGLHGEPPRASRRLAGATWKRPPPWSRRAAHGRGGRPWAGPRDTSPRRRRWWRRTPSRAA